VTTLVLVTFEHFKNARPSQLAGLYLLLSILFTASRIRTLALISTTDTPIIPLGISLASKVALLLSLQFSTRSSQVDGNKLPPERTTGLFSRYLVTWVLPLLWRGYRKPLDMEDLGAIDEDLHSLATWEKLAPHWDKQARLFSEGKTKQPLFRAALSAFSGPLAAPLFPYLVSTVVTLARPLIIGHTVTFVTSYTTSNPQPLSVGWGLVGATALTYGVFTITYAMAHIGAQRSALAIRGALMEALYRKSMVIRVETAREMGAAKASNLMSVDVDAIVTTVVAIHEVWTAIVMTGLGLYVIWTQIGISFVGPRS
jgi:ATP-binding cassette subfamily C (CFTR/MRP) protein 1